jgi:anhydro-N-acetylmuramic acid kinase
MRKHFNLDFDEDGRLAGTGVANEKLVRAVIDAPAWRDAAFKTTDVPQMLRAWEQGLAAEGAKLSPADLLATACLLTVETIARAVEATGMCKIELIASGGGTRNETMMRLLGKRLPDCRLVVSDQLGIPSEAKEAVAFALLGSATLDSQPGNVPSATGARRAVVLGSITPRP